MSGPNYIPSNPPHIYFAFSLLHGLFRPAFDAVSPYIAQRPNILMAYPYYSPVVKDFPDITTQFRWVLDSGAFTAWRSGNPIKLNQYIEFCSAIQDSDHPPEQIFGLDVIGDWEATARNNEMMTQAGIRIIPCFHFGEPVEALQAMSKYEYIAFGGLVGLENTLKEKWIDWAFSKVWPRKVHGFGLGPTHWTRFPFYSCDCSDWAKPTQFGSWECFSGQNLHIRKAHSLIRPEIEHWLKQERYAKARWAHQFQKLGWITPTS